MAKPVPLDQPVSTCGDWRLADLVRHVAEVQAFWAWIIEHRPDGPGEYEKPRRPDDAAVVGSLERATQMLMAALDGLDPEEAAWSWSEDETVGFTRRRQSHEALIHHIDAVVAAQDPLPDVDARLAADGVDELVNMNLGGIPSWASFTPTPSAVALRASDTDDTWTLVLGQMSGTPPDSGGTYTLGAVQPVTDSPDVTVEAPALTLDLWLWGRQPDAAVAIHGDPKVIADLRRVIVAATQ